MPATYEAQHTFSNFANWIVPGHVMLGRYPFMAPDFCAARDEGERQIAQILEADITTFVSLQVRTEEPFSMQAQNLCLAS